MSFAISFLSFLIFMAAAQEDKSLLKPYPTNPLLNEVIAFEAVAGHHFNLKSKHNCGNGRMISDSEEQVECQMFAPGTSELQLYVCDDANTFCRREVFKLKTQSPQGITGWFKYYSESLLDKDGGKAPFKSGISTNTVARGFLQNDVKHAMYLAKKDKKKILAYFTQISCPPCRLMKEMTFATDEFQKNSQDLVLLQIDIDIDVAPEKVKPLKIQGTPTLILMDAEFKELARTTRLHSPVSLANFIKSAKSDDETLYETLQKLKTPAEKFELLKKKAIADSEIISGEWLSYIMGLFSTVRALDSIKDNQWISQGLALMGAVEVTLKESSVDELQKSFNLHTYYEVMNYLFEHKNRPKDALAIQKKHLAVLNSMPRGVGVTEVSQLDLFKAEIGKDRQSQKKLFEQMKSQNQNDYSYDFWEANQLYKDKKYSEALQAIDKSLAVAKDRSWQKAFLLKMDILMAMDKKDEVKNSIDTLLLQIKLPSNSAFKIHPFVQSLRKLQFKINAADPVSA